MTTAFIFPGQGSQAVGMGKSLAVAFPQAKAVFDEVDAALSVMVGDTESDIEMGRRLGARTGGTMTVRIDAVDDPHADVTFPTLAAFAAAAGPDHSAE